MAASMLTTALFYSGVAGASTTTVEEQPIKVYMDNQSVSFSNNPVIDQGTTLVEFRPIFEKLGLTIGWDQETQTVTGTKQGLEIKLHIGDKIATVNGQSNELLLAPNVVEGHTMIPLRFVGEASGKTVNWDGDNRVISIYSGDKNPVVVQTPAQPVTLNLGDASANLAKAKAVIKPSTALDTTQDMVDSTADQLYASIKGITVGNGVVTFPLPQNLPDDTSIMVTTMGDSPMVANYGVAIHKDTPAAFSFHVGNDGSYKIILSVLYGGSSSLGNVRYETSNHLVKVNGIMIEQQ